MTFSNRKAFDYHTPSDEWPTLLEWEAAQSHYVRFDRDNTEHDEWIVVPYTYCPNVATLLETSNHEALIAALEAAGSDHYVRHHGHWATPYDMILVRPGSAAFEEANRCIAALADYPVLDDSDLSERENEASYQNVCDALRSLTFEQGGSEVDSDEVAAELHSWYHNNGNWGFIESPEDHSVRDHERDEGLEGLGWVLCDDEVYRPVSETEPVESE